MRHVTLLAALALAASPALATDIYWCGFENDEGYVLGALDGQNGWLAEEDVYVQADYMASGQQAMTIESGGGYDGTFHWAADQLMPDHRPYGSVVVFTQTIAISDLGEAEWLIQFCDFDLDTVIAQMQFTYDGYILFNGDTVGTFAANTWMIMTLTFDLDTQTVTMSMDDDLLVEDAPFQSPADKFDQVIYGTDEYPEPGVNYMDVDDLWLFTPPGAPSIHLETSHEGHWVYQNTGVTMSRGGHYIDLQVVVDDLNGNNDVSLSVAKLPGSGPGEVVLSDHPELPRCWRVHGSPRDNNAPTAGCGTLTLRVTCAGDLAGEATADIDLMCRTLGDLDGNGGAEPTDVSLLVSTLNGMPPVGFEPRAFDLDANGGAEPGDLSILINILNGMPIL
ncbi:MAG TPA: hypothetical protein PLP01_05055 [Phycisphaerae bacterium]|nr:hypothetical protein [Phycisphaerae bacterium]HOI54593.1 hypothetical protein [Phycisphaerae bacterium]